MCHLCHCLNSSPSLVTFCFFPPSSLSSLFIHFSDSPETNCFRNTWILRFPRRLRDKMKKATDGSSKVLTCSRHPATEESGWKIQRLQAHLHVIFSYDWGQGKGDEERSRGVVVERDRERARLMLRTQERQSDRQATRSHGNGKWREKGGEVEKQRRKKKKWGRRFRLKLHCWEIKKSLPGALLCYIGA